MFTIEKNIPFPSSGLRGFGIAKQLYETLITMEIKDSVQCTIKEYRTFGAVKRTMDLENKIFSARQNEKGYRIFRIK